MIIGDGVTPSNEGRGYVLRRLLRRIVRSARLLGVHEPVLPSFAEVVRDAMAPSYPELATDFERIATVVRIEEETFLQTLSTGSKIFESAAAATRQVGLHAAARRPGVQAARHLRVPDRPDAGDGRRGRAHRRRAGLPHADGRAAQPGQGRRRRAQARLRRRHGLPRRARRARAAPRSSATPTWWREAEVVGLVVDGVGVPAAGAGTAVEVILDRTPFYAEGGGQLADTGWIRGDGYVVDVTDVQSPVDRARRAPRHRARGRDHRGRGGPRRRSTPAGGRRSRDRTRPPTSCTRACARPSATPPRRRARSTRRGGCGSTSPRPPERCPPPCSPTSRTRSTTSC